jgi:hypothetical protein
VEETLETGFRKNPRVWGRSWSFAGHGLTVRDAIGGAIRLIWAVEGAEKGCCTRGCMRASSAVTPVTH